LRFPFSRLESEVLKELTVDQRNFEAKETEELLTPIDYFAEQFNGRSKLGEHAQHLLTDIKIQSLYFSDMMRIFLIDNLLQIHYEAIIKTIL